MAQIRRFSGINFTNHPVLEHIPGKSELGRGFRCKRGEFGTYWKKGKIEKECNAYTSRCWVLTSEDNLAGYITLLADKLELKTRALSEEGVNYLTFPAVKIGWLAADERAKGAGSRLVEWAMEYVVTELVPKLGIRFMTVDAFYDKDTGYDISGFYKKVGFNLVNEDEKIPEDSFRTMYFDLKLLIDAMSL